MKVRLLKPLCTLALLATIFPATAYSHGPNFTFRAYLDKRFWQPFSKYEESLDIIASQGGQGVDAQKKRETKKHIFAGLSTDPGSEALMNVRRAYRNADFAQARAIINSLKLLSLPKDEQEEMVLVYAKIDLREGEKETVNKELIQEARAKLQEFLKSAQSPSWQSEARGWLARTHYLLGDFSAAARIYLDELSVVDTVFSRESLICSLLTLFPYNGSSARLVDHLDDYFDTPSHALFIVNIVTNPIYNRDDERATMGMVAQKVIDALQRHQDLFSSGELSNQLALALMRASLYRGESKAALTYAKYIHDPSAVYLLDYNWMLAASYFLQREYQAAEAPLLNILNSKQATSRNRNAAAQGLIGVYQKTGKKIDQLHAAFLYYQSEPMGTPVDYFGTRDSYVADSPYLGFTYWPMGGWLFDLPYLLDVQLSDDELANYLERFSRPSKQIKIEILDRRRSAYEMVKYALAVRYAREEKYNQAAQIYEQLGVRPRAKRMRDLARLYAEATDKKLTPQQNLEARFAYAAFLEAHSTRIFFNDMLWHGFQTWTFINQHYDSDADDPKGDRGFTTTERDLFVKRERMVRDEQEERWRAFNILNGIVRQTGRTDIGRRAALKALRCLELINTGRFGRESEINAAKQELIIWLAS